MTTPPLKLTVVKPATTDPGTLDWRTAPASTLGLHKPLPSAVQSQQSALNQRKRGEDRHQTAMVIALLVIATLLRRLFSNRSS
jgi:hypothetical protein